MLESKFNQLVDDTLMAIEVAIDDSGADIDYDTVAGILTLEFSDSSKIIINRQTAMFQLWIAAKSGGFHLDYLDDTWFCKTENSTLEPLLNRLCTEQAKETVVLSITV